MSLSSIAIKRTVAVLVSKALCAWAIFPIKMVRQSRVNIFFI
jgi:hypothetical protein